MSNFCRDKTIYKNEQDAQGTGSSSDIESEFAKGCEKRLEETDAFGTVLGVRRAEGGRPGVGFERTSSLAREVTQGVAPGCELRGPATLRVERVEYQIEEIAFTRDMVIKRHGARTDFRGNSAYGDGCQAVPVGQRDPGSDNAFAGETISGFPQKRFFPG